tara:strand:+ start:6372 stop:6716 length:345 start_codon:yes stop_codon:yes gene_type:complete
MINDLIKIADFLDKEDMGRDADLIDYFIKKFSVDKDNVGPKISYIPEDELDDYSSVFNPDGSLKQRPSSIDIPDDEIEDLKILSEHLNNSEQVSIEYAHDLAKKMSDAIISDLA